MSASIRISLRAGALALVLACTGCHSRLLTDTDPDMHTDEQTFTKVHGVFVSMTTEEEPRLIVCLLPETPYLGPKPEDGAAVPAWLPFWTALRQDQLNIRPQDEIEFDVKTDWDTARPALITALHRVPRQTHATASCP